MDISEKNLIWGLHAVEALLKKQPGRVIQLYLLKDRQDNKIQSIIDLAKQHNIKMEFHSRHGLDQMVHQDNHQGVIAACQKAKAYSEADLENLLTQLTEPAFLLILDGVQDPHNLGACLRTADAAGVHAVIAPKDRAVSITPVVQKVASGAAETMPFIQVTNLVRTMEALKKRGIWLVGSTGEATQTLYDVDLKGNIAVIAGNEGDGMRRLTKERCDFLVNIPMAGSVSSLNVSVATGVLLFEAVRQRQAKL